MKKLLLLILCVPLIFSCGENTEKNEKKEKKKSWLEQWGYKGKMKSAEYYTYYASREFGEIRKGNVIDNPFEGIDEWLFPFAKVQYNLYGDVEEREFSSGEQLLFKQSYVYDKNELSYIETSDGKIKAINDQRGYLIKLDYSLLGDFVDQFFIINDNGYIMESVYSDHITKDKYDKNGNWIQSDKYDKSNTSRLIRRTKLSYDQNKRKEALLYDNNGKLFERHQYGKYDKEKNFTEIIIFDSKDNPLFIIDFTRKYYE